MNLRNWAAAGGVLASALAVALAASTPASAAEVDGWTANLGATVETVDGVNVLVMDQSDTSAGTSVERIVAGNVHAELDIAFTFRLAGEAASCGGGAPRVYLLGGVLYGQLMSCPAASSGWVSVTAADLSWWSGSTNHADWAAAVAAHQGTPLGQVGLVFDNAAGKQAKALFKGVTLAGDRVELGIPTPDPTATVTSSPSATPTATSNPTGQPTGTPTSSPSVTSSPSPSESESTSPTADPTLSTSPASGGGDGGGLPLTGSSVLGVGGVAGLLIAAGGLLYVFARRRRTRFEA